MRVLFLISALLCLTTNASAQTIQSVQDKWKVDLSKVQVSDVANSPENFHFSANWNDTESLTQYETANWSAFETSGPFNLKKLSFIAAAASSPDPVDLLNPRMRKMGDARSTVSYPFGYFSFRAFQDHKAYMIGVEKKF